MGLVDNFPSFLCPHLDLSDIEDDSDVAFNPLDAIEGEEGEDLSSAFSFNDDTCSDEECDDNIDPKDTTIISTMAPTKFTKPTNVK